MIRRLLFLLVTVALVAAACADDDGDTAADPDGTTTIAAEVTTTTESAPDSTTTAEPVELGRGVTDTEILVGIGLIDASQFGFEQGDQEAQWQAAIDTLNHAGGVHGRTLVPFYESYSPVGATEPEAACLRFTEDQQVFAFIGFVRESNELCYTELHDTIAINRETATTDSIERSNGLLYTPGPTKLGLTLLAVEAAAADGLLDGAMVHINADAVDAELVEPVAEAIEAAGATVTGSAVMTATTGDVPAQQGEHDVIVQRAVANGTDTMFAIAAIGLGTVGGVERSGEDLAVISTFLTAAAFGQFGYDPSAVDLHTYGPPTMLSMYEDGIAGVPECVERYETASGNTVNVGVVDPVPDNFGNVVWACRSIDLFAAIADAAGPGLNNDTFVAAAQGLDDITLTGTTAASLGPDKIGADDTPFVALAWDPAVLDFVPA